MKCLSGQPIHYADVVSAAFDGGEAHDAFVAAVIIGGNTPEENVSPQKESEADMVENIHFKEMSLHPQGTSLDQKDGKNNMDGRERTSFHAN